jgi:ABC-type antimicrobial peptide transport system permease subunit
VGQTIAKVLFGEVGGIQAAIGKEIRVNNVPLRVVGVLSEKGANAVGWDEDDVVFAPWTTIKFRVIGQRTTRADSLASPLASSGLNARSQLYPLSKMQLYVQPSAAQVANLPMLRRFADINDIFIAAAGPDQVQTAMRELSEVLRERHHLRASDPDDFRIRTTSEIAESLAKTTGLMTNLLLAVALISLVVGGVGIMNIMLVSVTERTREIGLRMAVGARGRDILRQFIVEAVLLCLAGGIVGVLLGRGVSFAVRTFLGWPVRSSPAAVVASVAVAVGVGLIFGYYPAWKASRLDPIEALRYE